MTTWILILIMSGSGVTALTNVNIESKELCEAAGKKFVSKIRWIARPDYVCVKGWEIGND